MRRLDIEPFDRCSLQGWGDQISRGRKEVHERRSGGASLRKFDNVADRETTATSGSSKLTARYRRADNSRSKHCFKFFERTNARQRMDRTVMVPTSKSRPPCRKRSQVHRFSVTGIVMSDRAVRNNRHRPHHARARSVHAHALRSGRPVLKLCVNSPAKSESTPFGLPMSDSTGKCQKWWPTRRGSVMA